MARVLLILAVAAAFFMIYAVVDVLLTERGRVRGIPKPLWVVVAIVLPVVGGVLWLLIGKDRHKPEPPARPVAPDDDPSFLARLDRAADEDERIRLLEERLKDFDDDSGDDTKR